MKNQIIIGDALEKLKEIQSETVHCCVTSPPYYGLRNYGVDGQIGLEETPQEYIDTLVKVFNEVYRVLKKDGTLWLNIGDSYAGSAKGMYANGKHSTEFSKSSNYIQKATGPLHVAKTPGIKRKELIGIPWMLALALRENGWYLRQDIIWHKTNAMPESVKDRCTKAHEYIFLLSKTDKYYFDYESIKEPCVGFDKTSPRGSKGSISYNSGRRKGNAKTFRGGGLYIANRSFENETKFERQSHGNAPNEKGTRNKRSVWSVATQGFKKAHFATFPEKLIEPCILAGAPENGIVLDPFFGSGTVGKVAKENNRFFIGIELNPNYAEIAFDRTR